MRKVDSGVEMKGETNAKPNGSTGFATRRSILESQMAPMPRKGPDGIRQ